jgi:glycosyltransferase involved in cell wall biosynthesis
MLRLKESNIVIIPSRMESIPQVIKEAFYLKVPIIATNVGGIPELITHEENGILIPPDNEQRLIEAINQLFLKKEFANDLAENGYKYVIKNLTWEALLPKYTKFYEDLLNS